MVPLLPRLLPGDERVDLLYSLFLLYNATANSSLKQRINIKLPVLGAMPKEFKYAFDPAHELREEAVVMGVYLMNKLVKVVLVSLAQINKRLDGLVRICRGVLLSALIDGLALNISTIPILETR